MTSTEASPNYNVAIVEAVILEVAAELHPQNLTASELALRIVSNAGDAREAETVAAAIRGLCEFGLLSIGVSEIVRLTPAGLRAVALLT